MNRWVNFLSLIPGTILAILTIGIAFLRFYDETDFTFLGQVTSPRLWSNRLTAAAILVALVNFSIEWNRRNRETDRLAQEAQRRVEEEQRRIEEQEQTTRRTRIEIERDIALLNFLLKPTEVCKYFTESQRYQRHN
jgi:hypothetical protein